MDTDIEWVDDEDVWPELQTKILSLKLCRNRCLAHATSEKPLDVASPVLNMLITILKQDGSLSTETDSEYVVFLSQLCCCDIISHAAQENDLECGYRLLSPCFTFRRYSCLPVRQQHILYYLL
jgi:hypothetical protein